MTPHDLTAPAPRATLASRWQSACARLARAVPDDLLAAGARLAIAAIFFQSGQTKLEGWRVSDGAIALFADEYRLPLLDPVIAAHLAAGAEHLFPLLLVLGLATRPAALALLGMTAVIAWVYPLAWPTHLGWAVLLAFLVGRGAGRWSLDRWLGRTQAAPAPAFRPARTVRGSARAAARPGRGTGA